MTSIPSDIVIVNDFSDQNIDENIENIPEHIALPLSEEFSFSNVLQYCLKESKLVENDINDIFSIFSNTIDDQIRHITDNQNEISAKMTRIDKLAVQTVRQTSSQISASYSAGKKLGAKIDELSVETDHLFDLLSSIMIQVQETELKLPENERITSSSSDHVTHYPRLYKYLASKQVSRPFSSPSNSTNTSTASIASIVSNRSRPNHSASSLSLSTLRNSASRLSPAVRISSNSSSYRSPSLNLQSVNPVLQEPEDLPQTEHDSASLVSQVTTVPRSFSMRSLVNWGRSSGDDRIETAQERLRRMLGEERRDGR